MAGFDNDVMYATNVDFTGGSPVVGKMVADGQLMIGSTVSPYIRVGTLASTNGTVTITNSAGGINLSAGPAIVNVTTPGAYPYTTLTTDYMVLVDTSAARTINLVAGPVTGKIFVIKDNTGTAAAFNITITPAAGNIDGAAGFTMNANFGSATLIFNGTQWNVV